MTAQETLDKGAIEMPTTGVKAAGKKCLTCISQGGGCPELQWWGSSVNPAAALGNRKARHATRGRVFGLTGAMASTPIGRLRRSTTQS